MSADAVKLLIVDDVIENLIALAALLRSDTVEVMQACSGAEALELSLVHDFALALLDVQMPDMDGFELAELLRGSARTKQIPIIFVTAGAQDARRVFLGYETGAVDFLYKPIDPRVLRGKVEVFIELYRQRRALSDALRMSEMFVGILGHDLRNPLGTVVTGAQLLDQQLTDEKQRRVLGRMIAAGDRMTEMIEQLLDLTRARLTGPQAFVREKTQVDIAALVRRAVEELETSHRGRELIVTVAQTSVTTGDQHRLLQLFSNLIANALRHGARGTPVWIDVAGNEREVAVAIRNRGVIPPEKLATIFDPFESGANRSTTSEGIGLGLYISQQIALAHDGALEVRSNHGSGETVFTVRLPRRASTGDA